MVADAEGHLDDAGRIVLIVDLWDAQGRRLDWKLTREELKVVVQAVTRKHQQ